jgi:phytoene synthase
VSTDLRAGRIYLPREDLAHFGYSEADLEQHTYDNRFVELMRFEAARARRFFTEAARLLPSEDRRSMVPAEIMRSIYEALLRRMERDDFRVFDKNYRLNILAKAGRLTAQLLKLF